jgi:maltose O-acetyltransferase
MRNIFFLIISKIFLFIRKISEFIINTEVASKSKSFGINSHLGGFSHFSGVNNLSVGQNVWIGDYAWISADGGLTIGDNTHIARFCTIYTHNHNYEGTCLPYDDQIINKPVSIGKNVWIGVRVTIAPGTKIGDGVIIASGTTVSGNIPDLSIVGSQKVRLLGKRNAEHYQSHVLHELYGGLAGKPLKDQS